MRKKKETTLFPQYPTAYHVALYSPAPQSLRKKQKTHLIHRGLQIRPHGRVVGYAANVIEKRAVRQRVVEAVL